MFQLRTIRLIGVNRQYGSIGQYGLADKVNCPRGKLTPNLKLTLIQTLTLARGNFPRGQFAGFPQTLKLILTLTQTPTLTRG